MERLLSLLPLLACPVGMSLMMWLMMRRPAEEARPIDDAGSTSERVAPLPAMSDVRTDDRLVELRMHLNATEVEQAALGARIESLAATEDAGARQSETTLGSPRFAARRVRSAHWDDLRRSIRTATGYICLNWKLVMGIVVVSLGILAVAPHLALAALPLLLVAVCPLSMLLMMRGMHGGQCASGPQPSQMRQPVDGPLSHDEQVATLQAQLLSLQAQSDMLAQQIAQLEAAPEVLARDADKEPSDVKLARDLSPTTMA